MVFEVAPQIGEVTVGEPLVNALAARTNEHVVLVCGTGLLLAADWKNNGKSPLK